MYCAQPGMRVDFKLPGFFYGKINHIGDQWQLLQFPDQSNNDEVGVPNVPIMRRLFAIPEGASVQVRVIKKTVKQYHNVTIEPVQRALLETEMSEDRSFEINEEIYNTDAFYPATWADVSLEGSLHGVDLGMLKIHPIRYNPYTGKALVAKKISLEVQFVGGESTYQDSANLAIPHHLEEVYKGLLLNYDLMNFRVDGPTQPATYAGVDYLIIADPAMINASGLQSLVSFHQRNTQQCPLYL